MAALLYASSGTAFLFLIEGDELVRQQFLPAGCAGRKTVAAVVNDGLDLEIVMHPSALQGRKSCRFDKIAALFAARDAGRCALIVRV